MLKFKDQKGFTLIELMIVVAIIGILAAIAIPNFMNYQCKANQREGQAMLSSLRTAMEAYYAENNIYPDTTDEMDFEYKGDDLYTVTITATDHTIGAEADATLRGSPSKWIINADGDLSLDTDGCEN